MGNSSSSGLKDPYPQIPKTLDSNSFKIDTFYDLNDLENIQQNLKTHLSFFKQVNDILQNFSLRSYSSTQTNIYNQIQQTYVDKQDALMFLFASGAIITTIDEQGNYTFTIHGQFRAMINKYVANLDQIATIQKISFEPNQMVVGTKTNYEKTIDTINNVLARIMFYKLSINFNWMLMFIFLVYVQNQFKILKHSFKLLNKKNDYNDVSTKLDTMLNKLQITAQNNKKLLLSTASKRPPLSKGGSNGAKSNVDSTITTLNASMEKLHALFNKSNESIEQFFTILDTNILGQMFEKLATISSNSSNQAITNDNIRNAISQLITHSVHSNTFRKEDISSILNEHNIDLTDDQKKSLLATISLDMLEANHTAQSSAIEAITSTSPVVVASPPPPPPPPEVAPPQQPAPTTATVSGPPQQAKPPQPQAKPLTTTPVSGPQAQQPQPAKSPQAQAQLAPQSAKPAKPAKSANSSQNPNSSQP
jgi:hypothetical protein